MPTSRPQSRRMAEDERKEKPGVPPALLSCFVVVPTWVFLVRGLAAPLTPLAKRPARPANLASERVRGGPTWGA